MALLEALRAAAPGNGISVHEVDRIAAAAASCEHHFREEFSRRHDHLRLVGQDNFRGYRPLRDVRIRVHHGDTTIDLFVRVCAARVAGCRITVSTLPDWSTPALKLVETLTESWAGDIEFVEETDAQLAKAISCGQTDRVRYAAPERVPPDVLRASAAAALCVVSVPVVSEGRLELLWYLREQSTSVDYHRYGNLGPRVNEARTEPL